MWPFFWFPVWWQVFSITADLLRAVSDRIAWAFNRSEATQAVTLDISKALNRVWYADFLHKPTLVKFLVWYLVLFRLFSLPQLLVILHRSLCKNIWIMLVFLKAPFMLLHFSYYKCMTLVMMLSVIFLSMLTILLSTLSVIRWYLICGNK